MQKSEAKGERVFESNILENSERTRSNARARAGAPPTADRSVRPAWPACADDVSHEELGGIEWGWGRSFPRNVSARAGAAHADYTRTPDLGGWDREITDRTDRDVTEDKQEITRRRARASASLRSCAPAASMFVLQSVDGHRHASPVVSASRQRSPPWPAPRSCRRDAK